MDADHRGILWSVLQMKLSGTCRKSYSDQISKGRIISDFICPLPIVNCPVFVCAFIVYYVCVFLCLLLNNLLWELGMTSTNGHTHTHMHTHKHTYTYAYAHTPQSRVPSHPVLIRPLLSPSFSSSFPFSPVSSSSNRRAEASALPG